MRRTEDTRAGSRLRFTSSGLGWLVAAAGFVGAIAWYKSINLVLVVAYVMVLLLIVNGVLAWRAVRRTTASRIAIPPMFAGERAECGLTVTNSSSSPVTVMAEDRAGEGANTFLVYRLPVGQTLACTSWRAFPTRGRFGGPVTVTSGFPFGFLESEQPGDTSGEIVVLPRAGYAESDGLRRWILRTAGGDDRARVLRRITKLDQAEVRGAECGNIEPRATPSATSTGEPRPDAANRWCGSTTPPPRRNLCWSWNRGLPRKSPTSARRPRTA